MAYCIIAIASVLIVLCIIIVIWKCVISKDKVESNDIGGSLVNKESELKELADQNQVMISIQYIVLLNLLRV